MTDYNDEDPWWKISNLTLGLLLALFVVLWFLTAIFWVYYTNT